MPACHAAKVSLLWLPCSGNLLICGTMNFDVDVESFFGDEAAATAAAADRCLPDKPVTVHQVYGFGVDWSDIDRFTISHMFGLTK